MRSLFSLLKNMTSFSNIKIRFRMVAMKIIIVNKFNVKSSYLE